MKWRYDLSSNEHYQLQEIVSLSNQIAYDPLILFFYVQFRCCGFQNSADHAVYRSTCSQESLLRGCHQKLEAFESYFLVKAYSICFGLVPIHILVIIAALVYSRPSMPWLGRYYGKQKACSIDKHSHDPMQTCSACENWTF